MASLRQQLFYSVAALGIVSPLLFGYALDRSNTTFRMTEAVKSPFPCFPTAIYNDVIDEYGVDPQFKMENPPRIDDKPFDAAAYRDRVERGLGRTPTDEEVAQVRHRHEEQRAIAREARHSVPVIGANMIRNGHLPSWTCEAATLQYNYDHRTFGEGLSAVFTEPQQELKLFLRFHLFTLIGLAWSAGLFSGFVAFNRLRFRLAPAVKVLYGRLKRP